MKRAVSSGPGILAVSREKYRVAWRWVMIQRVMAPTGLARHIKLVQGA
jgi:hypothetical protein